MRLRNRRSVIQITALVIAAISYLGLKSHPVAKTFDAKEGFFFVARVVDGDTLKLSDSRKVRLIGVDTPEEHYSDKLLRDAERSRKDTLVIQEMGKRASDFTRRLCEHKMVRLEFDVEKYDRYKRLLAYVYLEDGTFVNAEILEEGYGQVMTVPPNVKYADYFLRLQKEARGRNKGLWQRP